MILNLVIALFCALAVVYIVATKVPRGYTTIQPDLSPTGITEAEVLTREALARVEGFNAGYHAAQAGATYQVTKNNRILVDTAPARNYFRATHMVDHRGIRQVCKLAGSDLPVAVPSMAANQEPPPRDYDLVH